MWRTVGTAVAVLATDNHYYILLYIYSSYLLQVVSFAIYTPRSHRARSGSGQQSFGRSTAERPTTVKRPAATAAATTTVDDVCDDPPTHLTHLTHLTHPPGFLPPAQVRRAVPRKRKNFIFYIFFFYDACLG